MISVQLVFSNSGNMSDEKIIGKSKNEAWKQHAQVIFHHSFSFSDSWINFCRCLVRKLVLEVMISWRLLMKHLIFLIWMEMEQLKEEILSEIKIKTAKNCITINRILLNLIGHDDIGNIGAQSSDLMKQIDLDGSGMIDRLEWRDKWVSMQKILGSFPTSLLI